MFDQEVALQDDELVPVRVTDIAQETDRAVTIRFEPVNGRKLDYLAGQYVVAHFFFGTAEFRRAYSFSTSPFEEHYAITVKSLLDGKISNYLCNELQVGDTFSISLPMGDFILPGRYDRYPQIVFISGGAGITPLFSMLKEMCRAEDGPRLKLVYYNQFMNEVIFRKELDQLARECSRLSVHYIFTKEKNVPPAEGLCESFSMERIMNICREEKLRKSLFFVCGSESLIDDTCAGLVDLGVREKWINYERFISAARDSGNHPRKGYPVTIVNKRAWFKRVKKLKSRRGENLLHVARRGGMKISHRCELGSCGSCKVRLKSGRVVMDEPNCLKPRDAEQGYILSCVAYPSEPVVLVIK